MCFKGRIAEKGTYQDLVDRGGEFAKLTNSFGRTDTFYGQTESGFGRTETWIPRAESEDAFTWNSRNSVGPSTMTADSAAALHDVCEFERPWTTGSTVEKTVTLEARNLGALVEQCTDAAHCFHQLAALPDVQSCPSLRAQIMAMANRFDAHNAKWTAELDVPPVPKRAATFYGKVHFRQKYGPKSDSHKNWVKVRSAARLLSISRHSSIASSRKDSAPGVGATP